MNKEKYMQMGENAFIHTYNRLPLVLEKGEGVYLYDTDGKKYLDFGAGIAVCALGYGNKTYNNGLKVQLDKILHTSNYFYNIPAVEAANKLKDVSGLDRVFFTNSGTEAVEGAIKLAKKYAYLRNGHTDNEIIAMEHSFHGRSMGALSVTGTESYRKPFGEFLAGVKFAVYNDLESVKTLINEKTAAIILETLQGEGGIHLASEEFLKGIRDICDKNDIVMILDEIQCGMGRTGTMYTYEQYGILPDVMTTAKALTCGVPAGAFLANEKVAKAMLPGDHGSTYGGNPFACTAINLVFEQYKELGILEHVNEIDKYLEKKLDELVANTAGVKTHRGKGLMRGIVLSSDISVGDVIKRAISNGLIVFSAGQNVLRLVPPLVIEKSHVDEMADIIKKCVY
jgi:acetylornithine and succinylornithine aminotransferases